MMHFFERRSFLPAMCIRRTPAGTVDKNDLGTT
jgi:hypothetical protein